MLLNLFQIRLRARDAPEGHEAEGTVHADPEECHPGDEVEVVVKVRFAEGGPPAALDISVSPPEDFATDEPSVDLRHDGATVTIKATAEEEVELGTYYLQAVYSDDQREHFEAEAPLEVRRHWVRIGEATASPARASPGDPVEVTVDMAFEGQARVRGHVRGRLVPEDWDGEDEHAIKIPRERTSVSGTRRQTWNVRIPRNARETRYSADIEFSSQEGTARHRTRNVLHLVPPWGIAAETPEVEPSLLSPGDPVTLRTRAENVGREEVLVRVGGELAPEAGGTSLPLEEREVALGPGEVREVEWSITAPDRYGRWMVRTRARADHTDGADPPVVTLDVRPPNQVHVVGAVPSRPWAATGERVEVGLQLMDSGSRPGSDASITVCLEGESGEASQTPWSGWIGPEVDDITVTVEVPRPPVVPDRGGDGEAKDGEAMDGEAMDGEAMDREAMDGEAKDGGTDAQTSTRFALVVRDDAGNELLRVPGAVAVRKRVSIQPRIVKMEPDPTRLGDVLLPGERVVRTVDAADLTLVELSSGCRVYARGDRVTGVDGDLPMDDGFWDEALDAHLRLYTDLKDGLERGAQAARAEAIAMRVVAASIGGEKGSATGLIKDTRELVRTFDPDKRTRGVSPRSGPLAPLAAWLADATAPPDSSREIVGNLRRELASDRERLSGGEAARAASTAARTAADHLDRLAGLLEGAREQDRMDARRLRATAALVAAAGVAQVELHRHREASDPWATPTQLVEGRRIALRSMSAQLASLIEVLTRHRTRRAACAINTHQRAVQAAVVRDLEVLAPPRVGHSGDAAGLEVELRNRSAHDLELRLNVALPSGAWAILEPQARGAEGLVTVGPVTVPAHSTEVLDLVVYVPTTVRLDSYVLPVEVVPEPRDIVPEQGGAAG